MTPISAQPTREQAEAIADELREIYERVWIDREIIGVPGYGSRYAFTIYAEGNKVQHTREDWEAMKARVDPHCEMEGWQPVKHEDKILVAAGVVALFALYGLFHMLDLAVMAFFKWWGA